MSEHVKKKKRALQGLGSTSSSQQTAHAVKHAKKISEDDFQRWYNSVLHAKDVNIKHLKEKYDTEPRPTEYKKFDADRFDVWYKTGVRDYTRKHQGNTRTEDQYKQQISTFEAEHFETWYEHQMELKH